MKMSLLVVCLIGTSFFALSAASRAAPFGGGFHRSVQSGRIGGFVGGGRRAFIGREFHASSAFRRDNHLFFHHQSHRFFRAFNVVAFGLPVWYPSYYYPDADGYLENDNESYEPSYDYQYWDSSAARQQSELATRPNNNGPITVVINTGSPQSMGSSSGGSPYVSNGAGGQDKSVTPGPNVPTEAPANPLTLVSPAAPATKRGVFGVFDKLVLVSWLNDAGKDVIYVKNTETNDVERMTSETNNDQFRIVAIHSDPDPKLFEAVISNGKEQGTVRFTTPVVAQALTN
jgi:hypothetical protein